VNRSDRTYLGANSRIERLESIPVTRQPNRPISSLAIRPVPQP
jgi:hypothetical protein